MLVTMWLSWLDNKWLIPAVLLVCFSAVQGITVAVMGWLFLTIKPAPSRVLAVPILLFTLAMVLSAIFSISPAVSLPFILEWLAVLNIFYLAYTYNKPNDIVTAIFVATLILSLAAVTEFFIHDHGRLRSLTVNSNIAGILFAVFALITLHKHVPLLFVLGLNALLLTGSRGALLAVVAGLLVQRGRGWVLPAGLLFALGSGVLLLMRPNMFELHFEQYRYVFWGVSWDMLTNYPLFGAGLGTFGQFWVEAYPDRFPYTAAHSLWATIAGEMGLMGIFSAIWLAWSAYKLAPAGDYALENSVLTALFVHSLVDTPEPYILGMSAIFAALRLKEKVHHEEN